MSHSIQTISATPWPVQPPFDTRKISFVQFWSNLSDLDNGLESNDPPKMTDDRSVLANKIPVKSASSINALFNGLLHEGLLHEPEVFYKFRFTPKARVWCFHGKAGPGVELLGL
jgi:hypothetical protein